MKKLKEWVATILVFVVLWRSPDKWFVVYLPYALTVIFLVTGIFSLVSNLFKKWTGKQSQQQYHKHGKSLT